MRDSIPENYEFWLYVPYDTPEVNVTYTDSTEVQKQDGDSVVVEKVYTDSVVTPVTYPVVIYLHGRSKCGHNLQQVLDYGSIDAVKHGRDIKAFIVSPQVPCGKWWDPDKIMEIVDWVSARYPTDTNRVYAMGMSLGGYGTMDLAAAYPDRIAAAMALCGGFRAKHPYENLGKLPLWVIHGTADEKVGVGESQRPVEAIRRKTGGHRLLADWPVGYNHSRLARFFYMPKVYDWLFAHSLQDEGRPVKKMFSVTDDLVNNAYKGFNRTFWKTVRIKDALAKETKPAEPAKKDPKPKAPAAKKDPKPKDKKAAKSQTKPAKGK